MIDTSAFLLLVCLQVKHVLADYVLQTHYILENRRRLLHPAGFLHAGLHVVLTLAIAVCFTTDARLLAAVAAAEFAFHFCLDLAKDNLIHGRRLTSRDAQFWWFHGIDQCLHQISYLAIAAFL